MGAALKIGLSIEGWMRKSKRLQRVANDLPKIRLGYEGNHSVLHQANSRIAEHAIAHGDAIWTLSDGTLGEMAAELRDGLVRVARNEQKNCDAEMQELADMAREDIFYNVLDGKIDGPARTAHWNAYKAAHFAAPTPNMVASREWLNSLTAELVER
jgi:hypothetical protein